MKSMNKAKVLTLLDKIVKLPPSKQLILAAELADRGDMDLACAVAEAAISQMSGAK